MEPRQRHYINYAQGGSCAFITTTCLDFVHDFRDVEARDLMALSLLDDCRHYNIRLHAYVVMPHHIHLLCGLPEDRDVRSWTERLKANSAQRLLRILPEHTLRGFDQQMGLNRRSFWQRSFRSITVSSEAMFHQKLRYVHANPVRREMCEAADEYRWSSAQDWHTWDPEKGLHIPTCSSRFEESRPHLKLGRH